MAPTWDWIAVRGEVRVGVRTSRREQTTSTVIVSAERVLLVDPAWDPDELGSIADGLSGAGLIVAAGFATPHITIICSGGRADRDYLRDMRAGGTTDPRLHHRGMRASHRHNRERAAQSPD